MLEVRLGDHGPEAGRVAVAEVGGKSAAPPFGEHRAAAAAVQRVPALPADGVVCHAARAPRIEHELAEVHLAVRLDVADPDLLVAGAFPARVEVAESVEDVHRAVRPAELSLVHGKSFAGEYRAGLVFQAIVRAIDHPHGRIDLAQ